MAWVNLGVAAGSLYFYNFVAYRSGFAWLTSGKQVYYCTSTGSGLARIDAFTSANVWLPYLVNFKGELYLSFWDNATTGACLYKYVSGTTWTQVIREDSLSLPRTGLACTSDYIIAGFSGDNGTDSWDVRKSTDGVSWSAVAKPDGDDWDFLGIVASDYDGYVYIALTNLTSAEQYGGYMLDTESTVTAGVNLVTEGYADGPPIRGTDARAVASVYYVDAGSPYDVYRSLDRGVTRTLCYNDLHNFTSASVGGVDFVVFYEPDAPYDLYLYCYKYGDAVDSWQKLSSVESIVSATGAVGVARIGDTLYIHIGSAIYYDDTLTIAWPTDSPVSTESQSLVSFGLPVFGGSYFWATIWNQDEVIYLQKRHKGSGLIVDELSLGAATAAEVATRTYVAYVLAVTDTLIYVYGRMNDPLGAGVAHVLRTTDGGTTWAAVEAGFGSDTVLAGIISMTGELMVLRGTATGFSLYRGTASLVYVSSCATDVVPKYGTFAMDNTGNLYVASAELGDTQILRAAPAYTLWQDWSLGHPYVVIKRLLAL